MKKFKIIKDYSQILFIGLFLFGYLFGQIFFDSKVEIAQAAPKIAPTVNSVFISTAVNGLVDSYPGGTITPTVATSTTLHINGIVGDANGSADIVSVNTTFYRSLATSTFNCVLDNNSCYKVAACTLTADTSLTLKYDCTVNIAFYIDSTDVGGRFSAQNWVVYLKVIDTSNKTATNSTVTKEIATVLSLGIPTSINYGTINLGASTTAANNQEMTLTQKGNDEADIMVSGTNMTCASIGVIPVSAQKWALTDVDFISASSTALSATPTRALVFVGYRDNDALDVTKILYWNIGIATSSLKGICQGTSTLSVIAH